MSSFHRLNALRGECAPTVPGSRPLTGISNATVSPVVLPSFHTAQSENDSMGALGFHDGVPGTITTFSNFGFTFPGSFAFAVGADGPQFVSIPRTLNGSLAI